MPRSRLNHAIVLLLLAPLSAVGLADQLDPPLAPPWWTHPPGETTRLQYHSFITPPAENAAPDYSESGYGPGPDTGQYPFGYPPVDQWQHPGAIFGQDFGEPEPGLGDGKGASVAAGQTLRKWMWNVRVEDLVKEYFVKIVWKPADGDTNEWVDLLVETEAGSAVDPGWHSFVRPTAPVQGWSTQTWHGVIRPQPNWEWFKFTFPEDAQVDSLWVGTYCVPEPTGLSLLALGMLLTLRRR